ncbi:hypothetical protein BJ684DRAFT_21215 [Piptocephalis cylindrospora]|uniref:Vacuolar ATPase assembly protein VMA22 n=1 Tax=Piptocephalis cylindrospora TaxID=1907219 RepID=A0A4V1IXU0_9FUNG|nr:hypothetical protein BJ684DRAFT_21215 [Piptocephalis cylindrospora]|eukprot:RKP12229.1 hypothetical protein BJ684DRAFT_21215 [Piptocephalis cylindrospora]
MSSTSTTSSSFTTTMTHTCNALDTAIVEYMDLLSAYRSRRQELSRHMHSGFFSLTQAKHIMGSSSLSRMQYDSRMQASATV